MNLDEFMDAFDHAYKNNAERAYCNFDEVLGYIIAIDTEIKIPDLLNDIYQVGIILDMIPDGEDCDHVILILSQIFINYKFLIAKLLNSPEIEVHFS